MAKHNNGNKAPSAATNLIAGGGAGMMEALACHPLGMSKLFPLTHRNHPSILMLN